ncbi:MAG: tyrosine-protein phosphatase [Acidimicrobiia bacterium]
MGDRDGRDRGRAPAPPSGAVPRAPVPPGSSTAERGGAGDVRHVPFPKVFNFRDLGGYPAPGGRVTRWRTMFRADGIHRLDRSDLAPLGIRTVVDLRTPRETAKGHFVGDDVMGYFHLPILQETWESDLALREGRSSERFLADRYLDMTEEGKAAIGAALRMLADPDAVPLVFHCAAGKDRTGVLAALTLCLVGVPDDVVAADYALSRAATELLFEWLKIEYPERVADLEAQPTTFLDSPAEAMHLFLTELRCRHGSLEAYAEEAGAGHDTVAALQANLLF